MDHGNNSSQMNTKQLAAKLFQLQNTYIHCVSKNIPDIFNSNLKTNFQLLIIFGTNIPDTTWHQMIV